MTFPDDWAGRFPITSDNTKVAAGVKGLAYDLSLAPAEFWTNVKSDGSDIRITSDAEGTTLVARDVVSIDTTAETGLIRFDTSSISTSADTNYYLWAGNASATEPSPSDTYGQYNAYDSSCLHHWKGPGTGSELNDRLGVQQGTLQNSATWVDDGVLPEYSVDTTPNRNSNVSVGTNFNSSIGSSDYTFRIALKPIGTSNGDNVRGAYIGDASSFHNVLLQIAAFTSTTFSNRLYTQMRAGTSGVATMDSGLIPSNNTWYIISVKRSGTTARLLVDGDQKDTVTDSNVAAIPPSSNIGRLGAEIGAAGNNNWKGYIGFSEIYTRHLTNDEDLTLSNNELNNNTFWTTGAWDEDVGLTITTLTPINITRNSVTLRGEVANFE